MRAELDPIVPEQKASGWPVTWVKRVWGSLTGRLLAITFFVLGASLVGCAVILTGLYHQETQRLMDQELETTLGNLSSALLYTDSNGQIVTDSNAFPNDPRFRRILSGWYFGYIVLDEDLNIHETMPSRSLWDSDPPVEPEMLRRAGANPGDRYRFDSVDDAGRPVRVIVSSVLLPGLNRPIVIFAAQDRSSVDETARSLEEWLQWSLLTIAVVVLGVVLVAIWLVTRRLNQIQAALDDIREGREKRLSGDFLSEINPLVENVNRLLDHNEKIVDRARTHVGNLAHALKNPITVLMNESGDTPGYEDMVQQNAATMWDNVDHYLKRAQTAANAEILGVRTKVGPAAEDIGRTVERLNQDKGIVVELDIDQSVIFRGERQDLDDLIGNLVENAGKWCASKVKVTGRRTSEGIEIIVDDDGPGLSPEDRELAIQRGQRLDESTPGTGLGLAIVSDTADLYGGSLTLDVSPLGGLRARLDLPAAAL